MNKHRYFHIHRESQFLESVFWIAAPILVLIDRQGIFMVPQGRLGARKAPITFGTARAIRKIHKRTNRT
jgi:hypothetical protein